jgi:hypothetical protein
MNTYIITFGFNNDGEYEVQKSKPIKAESENDACWELQDCFETYEGISCHIISVEQI